MLISLKNMMNAQKETNDLNENDISYIVRAAVFKVYNALGIGLLKSVYEAALKHELTKESLAIQSQIGIPVFYDNTELGLGFRLDLLVNNKVIREIKSVEELTPIHYKQLLTYLKLSNRKLGLLINFNSADISNKIKRVENNL